MYTSSGKPIENGMLALDEKGKILEIGKNLSSENVEVEYYKGALCPGFINSHCHLELSHLKEKVAPKTGITGFIKELQEVRNANEADKLIAIAAANEEMRKAGIVAVGDISNGSSTLGTKQSSKIYYHTFVELFGYREELAGSIFENGTKLKSEYENHDLPVSIIPHSPYSVSNKLFKLISEVEGNSPLSIHNQESQAENDMFEKGEGLIVEMMNHFGNEMNVRFKESKKSSLLSVIDRINNDAPLLLVHNTFTSKEDVSNAEKTHKNLYWCFCPKANLYIENKLPNISQFLDAGVKCVLGTDSLASNDTLSIWEEILTIKNAFPEIELDTLITWATINGAEYLGIESKFGSFEVGKSPGINWLKGSKQECIH